MGGKSRKSGGVSERLIQRIKQGEFNKQGDAPKQNKKPKSGGKKSEKGFGFGIPEGSSKTKSGS